MKTTRLFWLGGAILVCLLCVLVAIISPVRISIAFDSQDDAARAGSRSLATTTPLPPTAEPPTAEPPTAAPPTAEPPAPTAEPPTMVPAPPQEERRRPKPTPTATASPVVPTPDEPAQVSIRKQTSAPQALPGDRLSFTLIVTNSGGSIAHDVVVTDEIPLPFQVIDLKSTKGDIVVSAQQVTAYPRTLAPGETQSYTVVVALPPTIKPGPVANTAIITTSTNGDDPGDNTSTTTVELSVPLAKQTRPPQLPRTSDTLDPASHVLLIYWPLLALAMGMFLCAAAARLGAFRQRTLTVLVGVAQPAGDATAVPGITLSPPELLARWRMGISVHDLVSLVVQQNPQADRLAISIAVQRMLREEMTR
jgi:uncharacterized repeat protein (TIGR01451 family)